MKLTLLSISGTGSRLRPRSSSSEVLLLRDPKTMLKIVELKFKLKFKLSDCIVKLKLSSNKASRLFRQVMSRHSWCNLIDVKECLFVCY